MSVWLNLNSIGNVFDVLLVPFFSLFPLANDLDDDVNGNGAGCGNGVAGAVGGGYK